MKIEFNVLKEKPPRRLLLKLNGLKFTTPARVAVVEGKVSEHVIPGVRATIAMRGGLIDAEKRLDRIKRFASNYVWIEVVFDVSLAPKDSVDSALRTIEKLIASYPSLCEDAFCTPPVIVAKRAHVQKVIEHLPAMWDIYREASGVEGCSIPLYTDAVKLLDQAGACKVVVADAGRVRWHNIASNILMLFQKFGFNSLYYVVNAPRGYGSVSPAYDQLYSLLGFDVLGFSRASLAQVAAARYRGWSEAARPRRLDVKRLVYIAGEESDDVKDFIELQKYLADLGEGIEALKKLVEELESRCGDDPACLKVLEEVKRVIKALEGAD